MAELAMVAWTPGAGMVVVSVIVWMALRALKAGFPVLKSVEQESGRDLDRGCRYLAAAGGTIGFIVLVGWLSGIESMARLLPGSAPMIPNSAIAFILLAMGICLERMPGSFAGARFPRLLGRFSGLGALLIGVAALLESTGLLGIHIEQVFLKYSAGSGLIDVMAGKVPGRMSISASLSFMFLGLALQFRYARVLLLTGQALVLLILPVCLVHGMQLLFGAESIGKFSILAMAIPSAFAFALLCAASLAASPDIGVMRIVMSKAPGGVLARRLLPAAVLIPSALGWMRWMGQLKGLYGTPFGLTINCTANILVFAVLIVLTSELLNRTDSVRTDAERKLRESETSLGLMADAMPQIVFTTLPTGQPDYYNHRWFEYTGHPADGAATGADMRSVLHPDDLCRRDETWARTLLTGEPHSIELRLRNVADGSYRWHLERMVPIRGAKGEIVHWIGTYTDVEQYKQVEHALHSLNEDLEIRVIERTWEIAAATSELEISNAHLRGVMDAATQVAIIVADEQRIIRMFNKGAEKMLQYSAAEIVGVATADLFMDKQQIADRLSDLSRERGRTVTRDQLFIEPALEGRQHFPDWNYIRKDGVVVPVTLGVTALRDKNGRLVGFLGIATDVTQSVAMELELRINNKQLRDQTLRAEMANRAKDQFLATLSHEIRTPMNAIWGIADILWESPLTAEQLNYVEISRRACSDLMGLINDMLDLSKIESGHMELERIEFDLEEVIEQAMELIAPKARAKKLAVMLHAENGLPACVIGDPCRLRQVLLNLMGNAVKFTQQGEIVLKVMQRGLPFSGNIGFAVSDTGIGIPADKLETIFEDFRQGDSSTTRAYGGTGLGLGISRRLVVGMGGRLTVESEVGVGSTFEFNLVFDVPVRARGKALPSENFLQGARALILDDNPTNCFILFEVLSSWGMKCREFGSAREALADIQAQLRAGTPYDVILLDCHMLEMNGFEAAKRIAEISPQLPVVMLSSDGSLSDTARQVEAHLAGYATKPVRKKRLFRLICDAMGREVRDEAAASSHAAGGNQLWPAHREIRLLVAEDMPDNQLLIRAFLKGTSHNLTFVEDGEAAVREFRKACFDLIFMDIRMPLMDGHAASRAIRELERHEGRSKTPIVALSANASADDSKRSMEAGCQAHLSKPISRKRLLEAIRDHAGDIAGQSATPPPDDVDTALRKAIEELIPQYLRDRESDLCSLAGFLDTADLEGIVTIGHNLKGSGAPYGFPEISRIGGTIEAAARNRQIDLVRESTDDLRRLLDSILPSGEGIKSAAPEAPELL